MKLILRGGFDPRDLYVGEASTISDASTGEELVWDLAFVWDTKTLRSDVMLNLPGLKRNEEVG